MGRLLLVAVLFALPGCLGASGPQAPEGPPMMAEDALDASWNLTSLGPLGVRLVVLVDAACSIEVWSRGRSNAYEVVGHLAVEGGVDTPEGFLPHDGETSAPWLEGPPGASFSASIAGQGVLQDVGHQPEWTRRLSQEARFNGDGVIHVGLVGLDATVPVDGRYVETYGDWTPAPETSATIHLSCQGPGQATLEKTDQVLLLDDWTLRGDGVLLGAALKDGDRLAGASSTGFAILVGGELSFFAHLPPDPEKVSQVRLQGPGIDQTWTAPPTTWVLGLGDVTAVAHGPAGDYRVDFTQVGATPFLVFEAAVYDFPLSG